jgi:hypothetical protein
MRPPTRSIRIAVAGGLTALVALLLSSSLALAKGESAGLITLEAPIPRDAEPGSTLTVAFTASIIDGQGQPAPIHGAPIVLKLIGPDGTTTEALATPGSSAGLYTASIKVPASGITSAIFGLRGSSVMADGTSSLQDLPFDFDGLLFTTAAHPAPAVAASPAAAATTSGPDLRFPIAVSLGLLIGLAGLTLALVGRRRSVRSA